MKSQEELIHEAITISTRLQSVNILARIAQDAVNKLKFECPLSYDLYTKDELMILSEAMMIAERIKQKTSVWGIQQAVRNIQVNDSLPQASQAIISVSEVGVVKVKEESFPETLSEPSMQLADVLKYCEGSLTKEFAFDLYNKSTLIDGRLYISTKVLKEEFGSTKFLMMECHVATSSPAGVSI